MQNTIQEAQKQTLTHLRALYENVDGKYFTINQFGNHKPVVEWFRTDQLEKAAEYVASQRNKKTNIYYSMGLFDQPKSGNQRGTAKDVTALLGLWADIDLKSEAKKETNLPGSWEDAQKFMRFFPEPTLIIFSGHGYQPLWLFNEPLEDMEKAAKLARKWILTIQHRAVEAGFAKPDAVTDISRVLRLAGTVNNKANPINAEIFEDSGIRYEPTDLEQYILPAVEEVAATAEVISTSSTGGGLILDPEAQPPAKFNQMLKSSKFRKYWKLEDKEKGTDLSSYDMALANMTVARGWTDQEIANLLIAFRRKHQQYTDQPDKCLRPDYVLLTIERAREGIEEARKGKVISLDSKRKQYETQGNTALEPEPDTAASTLKDCIADIPRVVAHLKMPSGYFYRNGSIYFEKVTKDAVVPVLVLESPIFISRLIDYKSGEMAKLELIFKYLGKWTTLIASRAEIFNYTQLVKLADRTLPVSSSSAKKIVDFLFKFYHTNETDFNYLTAVDYLGWTDDQHTTFIATPEETHGYYLDLYGTLKNYSSEFKAKGSLDGWKEIISPFLATDSDDNPLFPIARAVIAAYFTSPLLPIFEVRSFILHTFCNSGGGKTAANWLGASVWGNPEQLKATMNATRYSIEQKAGLLKNLPMFVDELQSIAKHKQTATAEELIYMIANDQGRDRGKKDGNLRETKKWRLIACTSGERALTESNTYAGAKNRVLELYGKPIPESRMASSVYRKLKRHYGMAGKIFMKKVIELGAEKLQDFYDMMGEKLEHYADASEIGNTKHHLDMVTALVTGDYLASRFIFGKEKEKAFSEAYLLGVYLLSGLESATNIDDSTRARDHIESWIYMNIRQIDISAWDKSYGWIAKGEICLIPSVLEQALKEGGFDPVRILKDWREKGWIEAESATRLKKKRTVPTTATSKPRLYVYCLKKDIFMEVESANVEKNKNETGGLKARRPKIEVE